MILVTRPEPGASETAERLRVLGYEVIKAPFLAVERIAARLPRAFQACLITSANACWALPAGVRTFAVGDATAAKARDQGAGPVCSANGDAAALAALAADNCDPKAGPLLLLAGEGQGLDLCKALHDRGFRMIRRVVYRAIPPKQFPTPAEKAIAAGDIDTALFFSAETARAFVRLCPAGLKDQVRQIRAITISPAVSRALKSLPWLSVVAAEHSSWRGIEELLRNDS